MSEMADKIQVGGRAIPTSSDQQARVMKARCDDVALDGAYAIYRMLSALSHTSIETIDAYLDADSLRPGQSMSIKSNPGPLGSSRSWAHTVACCLVWSGMATNYLDKARTRRSELRRAARALGVSPALPVNYSAKTRGAS